ncbi:hypothetical protein [Aquimarina sp. MMG016]|uniref:hypothetical protein n=1 Tax=Aquimarina sp. MMG016 TaxID=2822690 RepID=UPI001B3A5ACC|nr:hypothetical protein [Aquimarina sp. MMG016]MBQ4819894.1 hypothetical protein [Aquimarina sp. MMG016]
MEETITQQNDVDSRAILDADIQRWKDEDVLKLANHFHKKRFHKSYGEQYKRVEVFQMEKKDVTRFNAVANNISELRIHLALEKENISKHTFYPIIGVKQNGSDEEEYFPLIPDHIEIQAKSKIAVPDKKTTGDIVPWEFKKMIGQNWDQIDNNLIDDLFIAKEGNDRFRVHFYYIGKEMINVIKKLGQINNIKLYPGVDMNKFQYKEMISFAPTIGFEMPPNAKRAQQQDIMGIKGMLESVPEINELFIEYLRPCPPTCVP